MGVPRISAEPGSSTQHFYQESVSNTPVLVFAGRGNIYGFLVENNDASAVFIQVFNKASAGSVTLGTTVPDFTFKIATSSSFGKDANDTGLHWLDAGCVIAITTTRTGSTAPAAGSTVHIWYHSRAAIV